MNKLITTLGFLLSICQLNAQIESYDFANYITPDFNYRALELNPNFTFRKGVGNYKRFDVRGNLNYINQKLSRAKVTETDASLFMDFEKTQSIDTSSIIYASGDFYNRNQFFYKKKRFFTIDTEGLLFYFKVKENQISDNLGSATVKIRPHWGMGRAETITDAWHAKAILRALKDEGLIKSEPTHKEIEALARKITEIKNTRVIDFRFDRKYEMEQLAAYIGDSDLVNTENFSFFAALNDAWLYEAFRKRRTGNHWQIGPSFELFRNLSKTGLISAPGAGIVWANGFHTYGLETIFEKYISKGQLQIDFSSKVAAGYQVNTFTNADSNPDSILLFDANLNVYYLVSSRIKIGLDLTAGNIYNNNRSKEHRSEIDINFDYFISPRIVLNGNAGFSLTKFGGNQSLKSKTASLSVRYSII